ncbi:MAG: hypothetical protein RL653_3037 [Pseudomonadota bacterium]|jgi:tetratricopeptide (TPR) repeat protein
MRLTLCLTVKDEAALLPEFLARARGLWDELVAVDTGSTDGTVGLLEAAGAHVLHRPWTGDFSAARNPALEAATGDWVLVLDPDEQVSEGFVREVRALLARADVGAATVRMHNPRPGGQLHVADLLRLFRRHPSIRFRHPIHEDVTESVMARLSETGQAVVALRSPVVHLGYARAHAATREKKARDVAILDRALSGDPDDLYLHFKRLEQARFWGDAALWRRAAGEAKAAVGRAPARLRPHFQGELAVMVAEGLHPGAPADALSELNVLAGVLDRPSAAVSCRRGEWLERLGRLDEARAAFHAALACRTKESHEQFAGVRPRMGLVRLGLARGDVAAARAVLEEVLREAPLDREACLAAASLEGLAGAAAVESWARGRAADSPEGQARLHAASEWALLSCAPQLAVSCLRALAGEPPRGAQGLQLAQALLAAGEVEPARSLARELMAALPEAGLTVLLCDLALGESSELELALEPAEAEAALRQAARLLRTAALPEVKRSLAGAVPALAETFPWLARELGTGP